MGKALRNLVALNRKIFVCTIGNNLHHSSLVLFNNLKLLPSIVDSSYSAVDKLLLNRCLILLVSDVRQLNGVKTVVLKWDEIPYKSKAIF